MADIVFWNDPRPHPLVRWAPHRVSRHFMRPERNFGDLLAPVIVSLMLARHGGVSAVPSQRLLAVGSILHRARAGDVVWGSGRNGRVADTAHHTDGIDVRAVRGPLTREFLLGRGVSCPAVFGDPALLLPMLRPDLVELSRNPRYPVTFVSHIDDPRASAPRGAKVLSPRGNVESILRTIVRSELVVATSMHAVIVAEAFGVPARSIVNASEPEFKFADYYHSTDRRDYRRAASFAEAVAMGGERPPLIDLQPLIDAFPIDLFDGRPATVV